MKYLLHVTISVCMIALTVPLVMLELAERHNVGAIERVSDKQLAVLNVTVKEQLTGLRADTVKWLNQNVSPVVANLVPLPQQVVSLTDRHLTSMEGLLSTRSGEVLSKVDVALLQTGKIAEIAGKLEVPVASADLLIKHLDDSVVPDDIRGVVRDARFTMARAGRTMGTFESAVNKFNVQFLPHLETQLDITVNQFAGIATNINTLTKPKWYDRALGYGLTGITMYRDLNPGANAASFVRGLFVKTPSTSTNFSR